MSSIPPSENLFSRSLVEAWRADGASPAELRRGYGRFTRKRPARRALQRLLGGLVLGLLLGVGLAQAASSVPWRRFFAQAATVRPGARPAVPARAVPVVAPLAAQPELPVVDHASAPPAAPGSVVVVDGSSHVTLPSGASSAPYVQQLWQQVAAALRADDFERAQAALLEVERSAGGGERDAARLARAQLLASHGRTAEALALLNELQAHAQSKVVREQSTELSAWLAKNRGSERSTQPGLEIKQP